MAAAKKTKSRKFPKSANVIRPAKSAKLLRASAKQAPQGVANVSPKGPPAIPIDRGLKSRWHEALSRLHKARGEEMTLWDQTYEVAAEIVDSTPPLYLAGGFESARAFFAAEFPGQDERSLRSYMRVARHFDPADETEHGISKLDVLLDYLEATSGGDLGAAKIHPDRQRIKVDGGQEQLFADVSIADLKQAARVARAGSDKAATNVPPEVKVLRASLKKAKLGGVGVRLTGGKLTLSGITLDQLVALGKALIAHRG